MSIVGRVGLALLGMLLGMVSAQDGRLSAVSTGLVAFTVTTEAYADAVGCMECAITPDPGTPIVLEVFRQNPNRIYTLEASSAGWNPAAELLLEARYTVTDRRGATVLLTTDWRPLTAASVVFTQESVGSDNRVRVVVEYRLFLAGSEPAALYLTSATHRIRETGSAVSHDVQVSLPAFLALRLDGTVLPGQRATVDFAYGGEPRAYLQAVGDGTPLAVTGSDLLLVEVSTNHPTGYTVRLQVTEAPEQPEGPPLRDRILIGSAPAHDRTFTSSGPTEGFVTLVSVDDFSVLVDGSEAPGAYALTVDYTAVRNP